MILILDECPFIILFMVPGQFLATPIRSTRTPKIEIANEILARELPILQDQKAHCFGTDVENKNSSTNSRYSKFFIRCTQTGR
jgi:hypothetical protein